MKDLTEQMSICVLRSELEFIEKQAAEQNLSISAYVRGIIEEKMVSLGYLRDRARKIQSKPRNYEFKRQVRRRKCNTRL